MSVCDHVRSSLSALVDGELSIIESQEAEKHMLSCAACRQEWHSLVDIDNRLASALIVEEVNRKCAEILQRSANSIQLTNKHGLSWRYVAIAMVVAATLLLVLLPFFFETQSSKTADTRPAFVAQLIRATGPIRYLRPGANDWTVWLPSAPEWFVAGSRLKTDEGVLCEVQTSTKGVIRLNESAEVVFRKPNQIELVAGQLWCLAPASTIIDVALPNASTQSPSSLAFACPGSTEVQCVAGASSSTCDSVSPDNSYATLTIGANTYTVAPGETLSIDREQNIDRKLNVDSSAKIWQLPLLAIGTEVDRELVLLLDRLLAPIGMTKARSLNEEQIQMLGPAGAVPLLAYAVTESSPEHLHLRRTAVRLASELADDRCVRLLKRLTSDPDEDIARVAKETLNRIVPP